MASCSPPPEAASGTLRIAVHSDPLSLDPHRHNESLTFSLLRNVFEPLTSFDGQMQLGPSLAVSWENPDDSTWIFRLRPGVRFHDGTAFTAHDVVWSLDRARSPEWSGFGSYLVAVSGVRALDDLTVEISTARPYPILLNKLAFVPIVPRGTPVPIVAPVGTGPYRLTSYQPGAMLRLDAFADYWAAPPAVQQVEYRPIPDPAERVRLLETGEIDIAQEPGLAQAPRLRSAANLKLVGAEGMAVTYLLLRHDRPPLEDLRVRQAIDLAIDRRQLVDDLLGGAGTPSGQLIGRNTFGYAAALPPTTRDLERSRALLRAAGHTRGVEIEIETRHERLPIVEALRRQLAEAGIGVRPSGAPWSELYPRLRDGGLREAYLGSVLAASADASDVFDAMAHGRDAARGYGDNNHSGYANAELDALIEESGSTLDMLSRRRLLERCSEVLANDRVYLPLYAPFVQHAARREIDWQPRLDGWILAAEIQHAPPRAAPATAR